MRDGLLSFDLNKNDDSLTLENLVPKAKTKWPKYVMNLELYLKKKLCLYQCTNSNWKLHKQK